MYTAEEFLTQLELINITHVVSVPDSTLGEWYPALQASNDVSLIQVCREGEAWAVAAGLHLGGASPVVLIQCTGLFESGDALRNAIHDYGLPLFGIIGYRSYLNQSSIPGDTARIFTEPILSAWQLDTLLIDTPEKKHRLAEHYHSCRTDARPGIALIAEGRA
ncbi:MAG: thiamine pyrophosphate-binding protein [Planctomycetaceae bacterium]